MTRDKELSLAFTKHIFPFLVLNNVTHSEFAIVLFDSIATLVAVAENGRDILNTLNECLNNLEESDYIEKIREESKK